MSLLQIANGTYGSSMDADQFGAFVYLHELSHMAGQDPADVDTDEYNSEIIAACPN